MSARALAYLLRTRWKNRARRFLGGLARPKNLISLLLGAALVLLLLADVSPTGPLPVAQRHALIVSLFGFLLILSTVTSIGQEGLTFSAADLDLLFPGPFRRRDLVLYWFAPQYLIAVWMSLFWMLMLGGRRLPHPGWFFVGCLAFQVLTIHVAALGAQVGILVARRLSRSARPVLRFVTVVLLAGLMGAMVVAFVDSGSVSRHLTPITESPTVRRLLFPAVAAADLGLVEGAARLAALGKLLAVLVASLGLVLWADVGFLEASFEASRRVHARLASARRGIWTSQTSRARPSARAPRRFGARGALLWRDWLTLRRQLRTLVGGGLMVVILVAAAVAQQGSRDLGRILLVYLAMLPLWLSPPIGFRVDAPTLAAYRLLPLRPVERALGLAACSTLVPFACQATVVLGLFAAGSVSAGVGAALLPLYLAVDATMVLVEGLFHAKGGGHHRTDFVANFLRMLLQMALLLPGGIAGAAAVLLRAPLPLAILVGTAVQAALAFALLHWAGARLEAGDLRVEEPS